MSWKEMTLRPSLRVLRQFAGAWLVFLVGWGMYWGLVRGQAGVGWGLGLAGLGLGLAGLVRPGSVRWLYVGAMGLAYPVGWVVSLVLLGVVYYGIVTPLGLYFRLRGRDVLGLRGRGGGGSYWVAKQMPGDIRRYFKQY